MSGLEKLNFFFSTYGRMFIALFNVRLWPPFFLYLLVMLVLILGIYAMFSPLLSGWLIPLLFGMVKLLSFGKVDPQFMLHYPGHLVGLPLSFNDLNLITSLLLESLLTASGVLMFAAYFRDEKPTFVQSLKTAAKDYPKIILIWLVTVVLIYLLFKFLPELFRQFVHGSPRREMALLIGMQGLTAMLAALLVYAIPYLVIGKRSIGAAFGGSFSLFFRNFFTTYFFVSIPQFLTLALVIPLQNAQSIAANFNPELILYLTLALALLLAIVNFFATGCIVRFYLQTAEE